MAYLYLRQKANHFILASGELLLCQKPEKTYQWIPPDSNTIDSAVSNIYSDEFSNETDPEYVHILDQIEEDGDLTDIHPMADNELE